MLAQSSSSQFRSPVNVALPLTTSCALTWDDRKLFVRAVTPDESLNLEALRDSDRLVECLRRSPVELVKLDSDLSPDVLLRWAEACDDAKKACYVIDSDDSIIKVPSGLADYVFLAIQKGVHGAIAATMAALLFPVLLTAMPTFRLTRRWAVGSRGKVLDVLLVDEFQGMSSGTIVSMVWAMARLVNVAQGKMLLNDPMPKSVDTAFGL